jgi:hypothetical protein
MTNPEILKVKAIKAILEAIEDEDAKDAEQALAMVQGILGTSPEKK